MAGLAPWTDRAGVVTFPRWFGGLLCALLAAEISYLAFIACFLMYVTAINTDVGIAPLFVTVPLGWLAIIRRDDPKWGASYIVMTLMFVTFYRRVRGARA